MEKQNKVILNPKKEKFCQLFINGEKEFFGNGVQSYIEAYRLNLAKKGAYNGARTNASKLLTSANIIKRIRDLMQEGGLNDENITRQHLFLINQFADFGVKMRAIDSYYKLKDKFLEKSILELQKKEERKEINMKDPEKMAIEELNKALADTIYNNRNKR